MEKNDDSSILGTSLQAPWRESWTSLEIPGNKGICLIPSHEVSENRHIFDWHSTGRPSTLRHEMENRSMMNWKWSLIMPLLRYHECHADSGISGIWSRLAKFSELSSHLYQWFWVQCRKMIKRQEYPRVWFSLMIQVTIQPFGHAKAISFHFTIRILP
jgi:hypothetical protein